MLNKILDAQKKMKAQTLCLMLITAMSVTVFAKVDVVCPQKTTDQDYPESWEILRDTNGELLLLEFDAAAAACEAKGKRLATRMEILKNAETNAGIKLFDTQYPTADMNDPEILVEARNYSSFIRGERQTVKETNRVIVPIAKYFNTHCYQRPKSDYGNHCFWIGGAGTSAAYSVGHGAGAFQSAAQWCGNLASFNSAFFDKDPVLCVPK